MPLASTSRTTFPTGTVGSTAGARNYLRWIADLARGINGRTAAVILEPDAVAGWDCLPLRLRSERIGLIASAVELLEGSGASVYVDAGNSAWHSDAEMAERWDEYVLGLAQAADVLGTLILGPGN